MEPCPECGCAHIGTDVIWTEGVTKFCQGCGARPKRIPYVEGMPHAEMERLAISVWNEWAQVTNPAWGVDLRFSA